MTSPSSVSSYLALRHGPTLPYGAIKLALELEELGHKLGVSDGKLTVSEGSRLTEECRAEIKRWRLHLMALVEYCQEGHEPR